MHLIKKANVTTETAKSTTAAPNPTITAANITRIYFFHNDHLGTSTILTDGSGNPYQFFLNLPFGETMFEQHSYTEDYNNPYKFNGKELDEETGFIIMERGIMTLKLVYGYLLTR